MRRQSPRQIHREVASVRTLGGVAEQSDECENGTTGCPGPGGPGLPCADCFLGGEE